MKSIRYLLIFIALSGSLLAQPGARVSGKPIVFTSGDTSPSVKKGSNFKTINLTATVIAKFDSMSTGDQFQVEIADSITSVADNAYIDWPDGVANYFYIGDVFACKESSGVAKCWPVRKKGSASYFVDGDATPSVKYGLKYKTQNTSAVSITRFDDLRSGSGDEIEVEVADDSTSVLDGTYIDWPGDVSMSFLTGDIFRCKESSGVAQCWVVRLK